MSAAVGYNLDPRLAWECTQCRQKPIPSGMPFCSRCNSPKPNAALPAAAGTAVDGSSGGARIANGAMTLPSSSSAASSVASSWACEHCTFAGNGPFAVDCMMCALPRRRVLEQQQQQQQQQLQRPPPPPAALPVVDAIPLQGGVPTPPQQRPLHAQLRPTEPEQRPQPQQLHQQPAPSRAGVRHEALDRELQKRVAEVRALCRAAGEVFFDPMREMSGHAWAHAVGPHKTILPTPPAREFTVFSPGGPCASEIVQQELGTCWLHSALAVLAHAHPALVRALFVTDEVNAEGVFALKFWRDGVWEGVLIDAAFPSVAGGRGFRFARCRGNTALWVPLLEKAHARFHGGYTQLVGGRCTDAFLDLTGLPCVTLQNRAKRAARGRGSDDGQWDEDEVFPRIVSYASAQCAMAATCGGTDVTNAAAQSLGLASGHAYSVLHADMDQQTRQHALLLRNPWGRGSFRGAAVSLPLPNDGSRGDGSRGDGSRGDGCFWMTFADFTRCFTSIDVCMTRPYSVYETVKNVLIVPQQSSSGTSYIPDAITLGKRLCVSVLERCEVRVMAVQEDARRSEHGTYFDVTLLLVRVDTTGRAEPDVAAHTATVNERVTLLEAMLAPGTYCVVPLSLQANKPLVVNILSERPAVQMGHCSPHIAERIAPNDLLRQVIVRSPMSERTNLLKNVTAFSCNNGCGEFTLFENRGDCFAQCSVSLEKCEGFGVSPVSLLPGNGGATYVLPPQRGVVAAAMAPLPHSGGYYTKHSIRFRVDSRSTQCRSAPGRGLHDLLIL